jgi:hypothetical protein
VLEKIYVASRQNTLAFLKMHLYKYGVVALSRGSMAYSIVMGQAWLIYPSNERAAWHSHPSCIQGSDRLQTRGAGACGNQYFSTGALGITLARQTADRGLRKQQASPAEQNALSLANRFPLVASLCA